MMSVMITISAGTWRVPGGFPPAGTRRFPPAGARWSDACCTSDTFTAINVIIEMVFIIWNNA